MTVFEYVLIYRATKDEVGLKDRIILAGSSPVRVVLAKDERAAMILAAREIPSELANELDRVEIALRPF
jgi:hypothetical protein